MDSNRGLSSTPHSVITVEPLQPAEGAGERRLYHPLMGIKDGDYSACFERMGMGDLEVLDVVEVADEARATPRAVARAQAAWQHDVQHEGRPEGRPEQAADRPPMPPRPSAMSYCFAEWMPADDSDSDDDGRLLDAVEVLVHTESQDDEVTVAPTVPALPARTPTPTPAAILARSKLSIVNNVAVINFPGEKQKHEHPQQHLLVSDNIADRFVDVTDADLDEDEVSRKAPTPDNTPERSPSEENQAAALAMGVRLEPGSQLFSALTGMAMARDSECYTGSSTPTPECSPGSTPTGTLGSQGQAQAGQASSAIGTLGRVWSRIMGRASNKSQSAPDPQVCLSPPHRPSSSDGGDDDYLDDNEDSHVIDDLEATLEEVRLDGDADDPVVSYLVEEADDTVRAPGVSGDVTVEEVHDEDNESVEGVVQVDDEEARTCSSPVAKPSGLLSRLFSRSRTSTNQEATTSEPPRRTTAKRGKTEASSRDRLLLHRMKPRQPNKADIEEGLLVGGKHQEVRPTVEKEWADLGIQTDVTLLTFAENTAKPLEVQKESRALTNSPLSDVLDYV